MARRMGQKRQQKRALEQTSRSSLVFLPNDGHGNVITNPLYCHIVTCENCTHRSSIPVILFLNPCTPQRKPVAFMREEVDTGMSQEGAFAIPRRPRCRETIQRTSSRNAGCS